MNTQNYNLNIRPGLGIPPSVWVSQGDVGRPLAFSLYDGVSALTIPSGTVITIHGTKRSGLGFTETCTWSGSVVSIDTTLAMTQESGMVPTELVLTSGTDVIATANFILCIEPSPHSAAVTDGTVAEAINVATQCENYAQAAQSAASTAASDAAEAAETAVNALIATIPADYTELSGQVATNTGDIEQLQADLVNFNSFDLFSSYGKYDDKNRNGVEWSWNGRTCTVYGTASGAANNNVIYETTLPKGIEPGGQCYLNFTSTDSNIEVEWYWYTSNGNVTVQTSEDMIATVPNDVTGMMVRMHVEVGVSVDGTVTFNYLLPCPSNRMLDELIKGVTTRVGELEDITPLEVINNAYYPNNSDLNDIVNQNKVYLLNSNGNYTNVPWDTGKSGVIWNYNVRNTNIQIAWEIPTDVLYIRYWFNNSWHSWHVIGGTTNNYTQNFNSYNPTNTFNVSPQITSDTNNLLVSTGDTTDRKADIEAMLNATGICKLGSGVFWVSGVDMPDDTTIMGMGASTKIYLLGTDSTAGYAIQLGSRCTVSKVAIYGNTEFHGAKGTYPSSNAFVERYGILLAGEYVIEDSEEHGSFARRALISDCYIANFTGGGIACYNTGGNVAQGIKVINTHIWWCYAGIYVPYYCEFNSWTNVQTTKCYYGAIVNGGNNFFANCMFVGNLCNFWMDNSVGQSPNQAHSSIVGCVFGHAGDNTGKNIILQGIKAGELFNGCQISFGGIEIEDSTGIVFSGCSFLRLVPISISGGSTNGSLMMFNGCSYQESPTWTITDNSQIKIDNCYLWSGDTVSLPS